MSFDGELEDVELEDIQMVLAFARSYVEHLKSNDRHPEVYDWHEAVTLPTAKAVGFYQHTLPPLRRNSMAWTQDKQRRSETIAALNGIATEAIKIQPLVKTLKERIHFDGEIEAEDISQIAELFRRANKSLEALDKLVE